MKFLAILKDSLREATDAKTLYFMLALSGLVLLFLAGISYRPVTVEQEVRARMVGLPLQATQPGANASRPPRSEVRNFSRDGGAPGKPWEGTQHFQFVYVFEQPQDLAQFRKPPPGQVVNDLTRGLSILDREKTQVTEAPAANDHEIVYDVTTGIRAEEIEAWPHETALFYGLLWLPAEFRAPLGVQVHLIMNAIVNRMGAGLAMLISTLITAFFIPNMLQKGTVDLLLVKPISRPTLLLCKFVGGLTFMFLNTVPIIVGIWLVVGLRAGLWVNGFLLSILVLTFQFAVYYSCSTLFAVLTRSPIVAILMTALLWLILFVVGVLYAQVEFNRKVGGPAGSWPTWLNTTIETVHFVLPRIHDLDSLNQKLVLDDLPAISADPTEREMIRKIFESYHWGETLTVSCLFIAVMLGLACWRFSSIDY
jgi:ABC-type transport system involved in multi-copper enzyme maturation permease subunit